MRFDPRPLQALKPKPRARMNSTVPTTVYQVIEEARHWPPGKLGGLMGRLTEELQTSDSEIDTAWKQETRQRLSEIEHGTVKSHYE